MAEGNSSALSLMVASLFLQLLEFLGCSVGLCVFVLLPVLRMVSVLPASLSCITFLSLLELKGFLKILHSLRSKAAINLGKSAALKLSEMILADNLPPKSLSCLKCLSND